MLSRIYIKNYILIDELELDLAQGLNIITGETGAGKSILINAIDIAFGARAGKEVIKTGSEKAIIEITIKNKKQDLTKLFEDYGIDDSGEEIILSIMSREWKVKEREYVKIQSMPFYSSDGLKKVESVRDYKFAMLVKGIIFNGYKYLRYASGEEELYFNGNDEDNIINKYRNDDVIKKCRTLCGEIDFTIFYIPKYSAARVFLNKYKLSLLDVNGLG